MKREGRHKQDGKGHNKGPVKRRSVKKANPDMMEVSAIPEEEFAPDWHWGHALKEAGYMTPLTAEHLLEYTFDQLRPPEADATVSTLDACQTYGPYLATTLRMKVWHDVGSEQAEFGRIR